MPRRKLIKGDRVRITGPWATDLVKGQGGVILIGKYATVDRDRNTTSMSIAIKIDGMGGVYYWDRENLRALPRNLKGNEK